MAETGIGRFPGSLDPQAEEFRPSNSNQLALYTTTAPPPQVYYPYVSAYLPPPISEVQVVPFCGGGVGYPLHQLTSPLAYVSGPSPSPPLRQTHPSAVATRSLLLSSVPGEASETMIRKELEVFGEVRGVQMERLCSDGIATVHFYDLRHAEAALREIRDQHQARLLRNHYAPPPTAGPGLIAGYAVWAQFVIPAANAVPDGHNQGTIVIFNLDPEVTASSLKVMFQAFGPVKELRETPSKKHQKFVEFYDVRDAAKALKEMNGREINGKQIVIEFSRPGGHTRKFMMNAMAAANNNNSFSINNLFPGIQKYNHNPSMPRKFPGSGRNSAAAAAAFSVVVPPPRSCTTAPKTQLLNKRSSNSGKGIIADGNAAVVSKNNSSNNSNNDTSSSLGCSNLEYKMDGLNLDGGGVEEHKGSNGHLLLAKKLTRKISTPTYLTTASKQQQQHQHQLPRSRPRKSRQTKKFDTRFLINEDAITESSNCRDSRTTVMIKNIPNKYSQQLLLNMLDNHCIHCNEKIADEGDDDHHPLSAYDFVYLPIDFNNKCNVGYGFVNMTTPQATWRLYKAFHNEHWEVFNSRKICEVTYARVQGLEALKEHFKNSKFPCEMDHYLPVVFSPPRDGRQHTEPQPIVGHQNKQQLQQLLPDPTIVPDHDDGGGTDGEDGVAEEAGNDDVGNDECEEWEVGQGQMVMLMGDSSNCSSSSLNGGVGVDCCCCYHHEEDSSS